MKAHPIIDYPYRWIPILLLLLVLVAAQVALVCLYTGADYLPALVDGIATMGWLAALAYLAWYVVGLVSLLQTDIIMIVVGSLLWLAGCFMVCDSMVRIAGISYIPFTQTIPFRLLFELPVLIAFCVSGMLYTGGILDGVGLVEAFANCDSALSLVLGSFFTLVFIFVFYMIRRVIRFNEFCESFTIGVKAMIPAIMILCLAWTLSGICSADYLNIGGYVKEVVGGNALVGSLMPALMFVIAAGLSVLHFREG